MDEVALQYGSILRAIGYTGRLFSLLDGSEIVPLPGTAPPFEANLGMPPALFPIWSEMSTPYVWGLWYSLDRQIAYVRCNVEMGYTVEEVARNEQQFMYVLFGQIARRHHGLDSAAIGFANRLGVDGASFWGDLLSTLGGEPWRLSAEAASRMLDESTFEDDELEYETYLERNFPGLVHHAVFEGQMPGQHVKNLRIAVAQRRPVESLAETLCGLEVAPDLRNRLKSRGLRSAPWIVAQDQRRVFKKCLAAADVNGAWRSINSPGWSVTTVVDALARFAEVVINPAFDELARIWPKANLQTGGY